MKQMKTLAERAKFARTRAGLTQLEAAKRIGIAAASIALWENGRSQSISSKHIHKVAKIYGVSAEWLATGKETVVDLTKYSKLIDMLDAMDDDQLVLAENLLRQIAPQSKKRARRA